MNVEVESLPNCITTLRVEVPPDKVSITWSTVAAEYTRYARIPGFRPGKAPRAVVEKKFQKEIREELTKKLLSESCREAIAANNLRVLSLGEIEDVEIGDDKTMRFTATLVTAPVFELPDYKNIPVQSAPIAVSNEEVTEALENIRNQHADFIDVPERGLQMEDYAVLDYNGAIEGKPVEEVFPKGGKPLSSSKDFWIRMTPQSFFPGFCEHIAGLKVGESKRFELAVPTDFKVSELAGQKITYNVTIKGVKQKVLPELNEELAGKIAAGKNLDEVTALLRAELEQQKKADAEREKRNQIMSHLVSKVECELPESMVRQETRRILFNIVRENQARGVSDDALKQGEKELLGAAAQGARDRLKGNFILSRIAEAEKITVTKAEFEQHLAGLAARYGWTRDKALKELSEKDALDQFQEEVLLGKVLDFLSAGVSVPDAGAGSK
jgi:trigger factor